ncbi:hypothetical protein JOB18_032849 [Solea senegalensis]|uniref:Neugrin n=2 Tax=Solea senegalensis TaxID=28829 RepID=A0AAV6ST00_SOLSE|nr:neugrin [Solea senegalensis]KAG7520616.1 hypothetical protein JOB18_032849 [Solea senegalensis]
MSRPLRVLSLLFSRPGALSFAPINSCRSVSRDGRQWMGQNRVHGDRNRDRLSHRASGHSDDVCDEDIEDVEDVEDKLQALVGEERKKSNTLKYHILKRKMTPSGAPQRKLTWDAMEQIRYLKQEQPEEWTVERLAEGFSVTPDVILRVLRSKFVSSPKRKSKQDAKVMAGLSQQVLLSGVRASQDRLKLPGNNTEATLLPGGRQGALISAADQALMSQGEPSGSLDKSPVPVTVLPTHFTTGISKDATVTQSTEENNPTKTNSEDNHEDEDWDGQVFTEEQIEEYLQKEKPAPVVQVGNEFFDADGNFMYRI